ncbi:hypothetical protein DXG03_006785 [Asterophora parasitica]|uniref:AMP-dependent synthetase/ligase domain-containing protein n=1 Tax=Asterophora parasitica TaxID=117018 RepID=A0A9P7KB01_9AGAR|nr:hypothetical protein DXG03_006785 [Asterophora parasitica]
MLAALAASDRALFFTHGIGAPRPIPIPIVHHEFQAQARAHPDLVAIEHFTSTHHESITYAALDAASDRLAHTLRALAIGPATRVAVLARRSVALGVAVLAVLKAGAQYVPLDARTITDETLAFVLADAKPRAVLAMDEFVHRVLPMQSSNMNVLSVEEEMQRMQSEMPDDRLVKVEDLSSPEDGAYCIYTSGTTGRPKGVDVRHIGIANVLSAPPANMYLAPGTRIASLLNIAFDMGAWELLGAFINGATLCLRGSTQADWRRVLATVEVVIATPTILARHDPKEYPKLRRVVVGGEVCPVEISVCNTVTPPLAPSTAGEKVPIGAPIGNTSVYILREEDVKGEGGSTVTKTRRKTRLVPVPIGDVGSMWVGGVGVSGGYLNLPDKTRERWRRDLFIGSTSYAEWLESEAGRGRRWTFDSGDKKYHNDEEEEEEDGEWAKNSRGGWARPMMFNTGDLGRWRPDGQLEHLGRADDQVKVHGFRVELDGVGASLRTHPEVHTSTALLIDGALWGFVTLVPPSSSSSSSSSPPSSPNALPCTPERPTALQYLHLSPPSPPSPAPASPLYLAPSPALPTLFPSPSLRYFPLRRKDTDASPNESDAVGVGLQALDGSESPRISEETETPAAQHTVTVTDTTTQTLLAAIRAAAARTQPPYAVPRLENMLVLPAFPVTRNGKVDKRALRDIVVARGREGQKEGEVVVEADVTVLEDTGVNTSSELELELELESQSHDDLLKSTTKSNLPTGNPQPTTRGKRRRKSKSKSKFNGLEESLMMVRVDLALA